MPKGDALKTVCGCPPGSDIAAWLTAAPRRSRYAQRCAFPDRRRATEMQAATLDFTGSDKCGSKCGRQGNPEPAVADSVASNMSPSGQTPMSDLS
jgi:hypothetical protein